MTHTKHLQDLLQIDNLAQFLTEILDATEQNGQASLHLDILLQSATFHGNERDKRNGIIYTEDYTLAKAKVRSALSNLLLDYEDNGKYIWKKEAKIEKKEIYAEVSTAQLLKLLNVAFDDNDLQMFCMTHFEEVYNNFAAAQPKNTKIMALVDYCKRHLKTPVLLEAIKEERPEMYEKYIANG